jgi:hypothetical protein
MLGRHWRLLAWLLAVALLTRISAFGDGAYSDDEAFYFLVGLRMHDGLLPYVGIWDRKGPGLFALYYLMTGVSHAFIASQVTALFAATATAFIAAKSAELISNRSGGNLAGTAYLVMLPFYGGAAGQSPVFYNLLIAMAGLLVLQSRDTMLEGRLAPRLYGAMFSAGTAITFKQTAAPEAAYLGCYCLWLLRRGGASPGAIVRASLKLGCTGLLPIAAFALGYALLGHFTQFWQAMVGANLQRIYYPPVQTFMRAGSFLLYCLPPVLLAIGGLLVRTQRPDSNRAFLLGWLLASAVGIVLVPNFFHHYALPLLLPASIIAGRLMLGELIWKVLAAAMLAITLVSGPAFAFAERARSRANMASLTREILKRDHHPRLLIYEGPVDLYRQVGSTPPTPLLFPMHLFHVYESRSSPMDPAAQLRRILAWRPSVVVKYRNLGPGQENPQTLHLIEQYVATCRPWFTKSVPEVFAGHEVIVYGDCASAASAT